MSLIKCYWILQNARVTPFTTSELLREKQQGGGGVKLPPSQPRLGFSNVLIHFIKSYPKAYRFQADPKKK